MTISNKDLIYWHEHFKHLLSGWTVEEQIQFLRYSIQQLEGSLTKGGTK